MDCLYNASCNPFNAVGDETNLTFSLQKEFLKYWSEVAKYFADSEYVIGYDLINEPTAGNLWQNPGAYINTKHFEAAVM